MLKKMGICKWVYFSIYPFYVELYILLITVSLVDRKKIYNIFQNKFTFKTPHNLYLTTLSYISGGLPKRWGLQMDSEKKLEYTNVPNFPI